MRRINFFVLTRKYPCLVDLVKKFNIICLSLNVVIWYFEYVECDGEIHLFCFWPGIPCFGNSDPELKNCLKWNLVLRITWIFEIRWWCFICPVSAGKILSEKIYLSYQSCYKFFLKLLNLIIPVSFFHKLVKILKTALARQSFLMKILNTITCWHSILHKLFDI